jgi:hypothetical protein
MPKTDKKFCNKTRGSKNRRLTKKEYFKFHKEQLEKKMISKVKKSSIHGELGKICPPQNRDLSIPEIEDD